MIENLERSCNVTFPSMKLSLSRLHLLGSKMS